MKTRDPRLTERLIAVVAAGAFILNFPLIGLFTVGGHLFGVPALYFYLFGAWMALIVLIALLSDRPRNGGESPEDSGRPDA